MNRSGLIAIVDEKGREKESYHVVYGAGSTSRKTRRSSR